MSTPPEYTSGSNFDRLQVQLELNVVSQYKGIMSNSSQNASQGVSPSISAVDTGIKAAMSLSGALTSGIESAYLPALEALGLSGMACLPIRKQLDPMVGVDCYIMIPGGPLPNPYISLLLNPKDFLAVALTFILPPPMPMARRCKTSVGTLTESLVYRLINGFYRQEWKKVSTPT